ncbi:hypothetical protein [Streptomyces odontomachi]|uniref:hypothetical protein n=1 Tax=Streptomyces odontomachi TaxID=2944940 RepID=UPI00210AC9BE|nr:hypothetical protein [Streptomyces sp. ODS25]
MEAAVLEQTLRDHPDDLASWHAYGEQLVAQGDARGTLIRLEERRACARPADREALGREIDALVTEHQEAWDAALPAGVTVVARRHGFPTGVAVTLSDDAPAMIEKVLQERFVTGMRIKGVKGTDDDDDEDDWDEEEDWDEDDEEPDPRPVDVSALATLDLGRLVELDLSYLPIGAAGAALLASTASSRLETLDLRYCYIGDAGVAALAASLRFDGLRRLHLQRNKLTAEGVRSLGLFGGLTELDLRYNPIGAEGAEALLEAPFIGSLKQVQLYRDDVSDEGAAKLASATQLSPVLRSYWRSV